MVITKARRDQAAAQMWWTDSACRFDAGDANLRRVEGNDPVNQIDPNGLASAPASAKGMTNAMSGIATAIGDKDGQIAVLDQKIAQETEDLKKLEKDAATAADAEKLYTQALAKDVVKLTQTFDPIEIVSLQNQQIFDLIKIKHYSDKHDNIEVQIGKLKKKILKDEQKRWELKGGDGTGEP